jgi:hypothetical protein
MAGRRRPNSGETSENPYELSKTPAPAAAGKRHPPTHYDAEEIVALTEGYHQLTDPKLWPGIPRGSHLRFIKKDGKFLTGGFLHNYHRDAATGEEAFFVETGFDPKSSTYMKFKLAFDNIKTVYKKDDHTLVSVTDFAGIARDLVARIEQLEKNLARLSKIVGMMTEKR